MNRSIADADRSCHRTFVSSLAYLAACVLVVSLSATGCSDDPSGTTAENPGEDCPEGQEYDPFWQDCRVPDGTRTAQDSGVGPPPDPDTGQPDTGALPDTDATPPDTAGAADTGDGGPNDTGGGMLDTPLPDASPGDGDGDGVLTRFDNCPGIANSSQADGDGDGVGDVCDNCPKAANRGQADQDNDGTGDACTKASGYDPTRDNDGDGVADKKDLCPGTKNAAQKDSDGDKLGDACDNCPNTPNYAQTDSDADGTGDACSTAPVGKICDTQKANFKSSGLKPNVYILLDISGSMKGTPLTQAKQGLNQISSSLAGSARIGLSAYPVGGRCTSWEYLSLGNHSTSAIQGAYANLSASGTTPTGNALYTLRSQNALTDPNDPQDSQRTKAVILITDGTPNSCEGIHPSATQAKKFYQNGTRVFVVGFKSGADPRILNNIARAGGTDAPGPDLFYTANNSSSLVSALGQISSRIVPCNFTLDRQPPDANKLWVTINGTPIPEDPTTGYTYDTSTNTVRLSQQACQTLRSAAKNAGTTQTSAPMTIKLGCETKCTPNKEVCDYKDNDCDGEIDEGCGGCSQEVCDGRDNDCDGLVDEGCNKCRDVGDRCQKDWECCSQNCQQGSCAKR